LRGAQILYVENHTYEKEGANELNHEDLANIITNFTFLSNWTILLRAQKIYAWVNMLCVVVFAAEGEDA
jgi:hypothetical protein